MCTVFVLRIFFVKQKTAYVMRISDWSSDVCSSDLSYCCPGLTFMLACSGRNDHGSFEFTPPSNCTVISRSDLRPSSAAARSPSTADFSNRTPNTFSQAMRYIGTSEIGRAHV